MPSHLSPDSPELPLQPVLDIRRRFLEEGRVPGALHDKELLIVALQLVEGLRRIHIEYLILRAHPHEERGLEH